MYNSTEIIGNSEFVLVLRVKQIGMFGTNKLILIAILTCIQYIILKLSVTYEVIAIRCWMIWGWGWVTDLFLQPAE